MGAATDADYSPPTTPTTGVLAAVQHHLTIAASRGVPLLDVAADARGDSAVEAAVSHSLLLSAASRSGQTPGEELAKVGEGRPSHSCPAQGPRAHARPSKPAAPDSRRAHRSIRAASAQVYLFSKAGEG